jgi:uncharacterized protein YdeI (YjbR/CyaY-like superfamily)
MDAIFFADPAEVRDWLGQNHDRATELWLGLYKKNSGRSGISYAEALDQALCFGWIDGKVRSVDELSYAIRFTPRKRDSIWSQSNIKRVGELAELGLMHPAGLERFNSRRPDRERIYSHEADPVELDSAYEATLRSHEAAWSFFTAQAPTYQRVVRHWIMGAKREVTRLKRLNELIEASAEGRRLPQFTSPGTRTGR